MISDFAKRKGEEGSRDY